MLLLGLNSSIICPCWYILLQLAVIVFQKCCHTLAKSVLSKGTCFLRNYHCYWKVRRCMTYAA